LIIGWCTFSVDRNLVKSDQVSLVSNIKRNGVD